MVHSSRSPLVKAIFIVGLPRTGSTLWAKIIAKNPHILVFDEMHYLSPLRKDFRYVLKKKAGNLESDDNVRNLVEVLFHKNRLEGFRGGFWVEIKRRKQELKPIILERILKSDRSLWSIFKILVEEGTRSFGYNQCLVKFPVHFAYVRQLRAWFPEAKIIQITRDPRATAVSKSSDPGGTEKLINRYAGLQKAIVTAAKVYVILQYILSSHIYKKMKHIDNYRLFSFEELLVRPEATLSRLCDFLNIEYSDTMLEMSKGQPSSITGLSYNGLNPEAAISWRNKMSNWESRLIYEITKKSMSRLDYNPNYYHVVLDKKNCYLQ